MLKKLRNKMLLIILISISLLMFCAFGVIYTITHGNVNRQIAADLNRVADMAAGMGKPGKPAGKPGSRQPQGTDTETAPASAAQQKSQGSDEGDSQQEQIPSEQAVQNQRSEDRPALSPSFFLELDENNEITKINSVFDLEESFYAEVKNQVLAEGASTGNLKMEGLAWSYKLVTLPGRSVLVFLDTSSQRSILVTLIFTFILVYLGALGVIFLLSLFFANRAIKPVEEAWERQRQFVGDASHELKTPLTTINTNIDVMLSRPDSTVKEQSKWLRYIKGEAQRMTKLTNDLLYLARIDQEDSGVLYDKISFSQAAEEVILTMEAVVFEQDVKLDYTIEPDIFVLGSEEQLKQLVLILLDNAVKYTPKKGMVFVSLMKKNQKALLSVSNTGDAIAPEDLTHLFDRFYRADQSRARESGGYGLGLAIARSIVTAHQGKISVSSIPGCTEFTVAIPCIP